MGGVAVIQGIGTDLVAVARVRQLMADGGLRFLTRWFTAGEVTYCQAKAHPERHFAARLAAKESVVKALRRPGDGPVPWREIEITVDEIGAPAIVLRDSLAQAVPAGACWHVSLSHTDDQASAVVLLDVPDPAHAAAWSADADEAEWALPEPILESLEEYERTSAARAAADPQLEAIRLAILIEDVADVVLPDEHLDPASLADTTHVAEILRQIGVDG